MEKIRFDFLQDFIIIDRPTNSTKGFTMHMAVVLRNGKTVIDSGFMFDLRREDGELAYNMKMNPVRVLEDFFDNERFRILCKEIWLGDWVLNCSTGKIVLHNDYTSRWPGKGNN